MRLALTLLAIGVVALSGCGRVVPPGKTIIIRKPSGNTTIKERGVYKAWGRDRIYIIDNKLNAYEERDMRILCEDEINMDVDVKALLSFEVTAQSVEFIQAKIPTVKTEDGDITGWELSLDKFYGMAVKPIVRAAARDVISKYQTDDIRPNREKITNDIDQMVRRQITTLGYPLHVSAVLISNIDYPQVVRDQREAIKNAQLEDQRRAALAEAEIAEAQRQVSIETERAKVRMIRAQAQADENRILTQSLTPEFLQWRQYEVLEHAAAQLAAGANNTVFMMPYSSINQDTLNAALIRDSVASK